MPETRTRRSFYLIALLLPILLLGILEGLLRLTGVAAREPLFEPAPVAGLLQPNERVVRRFFADPGAAPPVSIDTTYFETDKQPATLRVVIQGGSSAAGFPYGRWASPAGMLQQRLERVFPGRRIEIISTAMSAVNSYTLLDFVDEIVAIEPDAVIVYAGHNEFLGIQGVGSAYASSRSPAAARAVNRLRRLHLVELAFRIYGWFTAEPDRRTGTLMARVARERRIPSGSELFEMGHRQFAGNLEHMLQRYAEHGIPVFVGTLAANEKDQAPFLSAVLPSEHADAWEKHRSTLEAALRRDDPAAALSQADMLVELAPSVADAWYLHGRALLAAGEPVQARSSFLKAKDLDELRFRAPESFNEIIRETAAAQDATVIDVQGGLRAASADALIGREMMLEHLHPNVDGYFEMADAMFDALLDAGIGGRPGLVIDKETARAEIPVTVVDRLAGRYRVERLMLDWPFRTEKEDYEPPAPTNGIEQIADEWFDGKLAWNVAMSRALAVHQRRGELDEAVRVGWNLASAFPFEAEPAFVTGSLMLRLGQAQRALPILHRAARLEPRNTRYLMALAQAFHQSGRDEESIQLLERVLSLEPDHPSAGRFLRKVREADGV